MTGYSPCVLDSFAAHPCPLRFEAPCYGEVYEIVYILLNQDVNSVKMDWTKVSMGIVSTGIGLMLSLQINSIIHSPGHISLKQWSKQEALIQDLQKQNDNLMNEAIMLRNKLALESSDERSQELNEKLANVNIAAGLTSVSGPGIVINLDDNPDPLRIGDNPDDYLIHDHNLLFLINDLRGAGAEAISINEQRILASSEIRCAGPTILVNTTRVGAPFEIKAIGNPEGLERFIRTSGQQLRELEARGIKINIKKSGKVVIPALSGVLTYNYAQAKT